MSLAKKFLSFPNNCSQLEQTCSKSMPGTPHKKKVMSSKKENQYGIGLAYKLLA